MYLLLLLTCSLSGNEWQSDCPAEPYQPAGPRVEDVSECPAFPASCPLACTWDQSCPVGTWCEDCDTLQAWLDANCGKGYGFGLDERGILLGCDTR